MRTGLDLSAVRGHGQVRNRRIFGLTRTVAHHARVAVLVRHGDRVERLRKRSDLVDLDQNRVGDALFDSLGETHGVRDKKIVADQLHAIAKDVGLVLPAGPFVLVQAVLDGEDRVLVTEILVESSQLFVGQALAVEVVEPVVLQHLGAGHVEGNSDVPIWLETGLFDRGQD